MKIHGEAPHTTYPDYLFCQPSALRTFPASVEIGNKWLVHGSGIGWDINTFSSALGEFFERRHFYLDIPEDHTDLLESSLTEIETNDFVKAFLQTSNRAASEGEIKSNQFQLTNAWRTKDWSPCRIPTACLSLSPLANNAVDDNYFPSRDTCGCCLHWSVRHAIMGALSESLERQFLTRFWLTNTCHKILEKKEIQQLLDPSQCKYFFEHLSTSGCIHAFDISDYSFPGSCVIIVYGSNISGRAVKYCTGMSYAKNQKTALEKSLLELWQTYRFMNLFYNSNSDISTIRDEYLKHFLDCNSSSTLSFFEKTIEKNSPNTNPENFSAETLLKILRSKELNGYIYLNTITVNGSELHACKFISPNLFMHMNNSKNINIKNRYSDSFNKNILNSRLKTMVPFP